MQGRAFRCKGTLISDFEILNMLQDVTSTTTPKDIDFGTTGCEEPYAVQTLPTIFSVQLRDSHVSCGVADRLYLRSTFLAFPSDSSSSTYQSMKSGPKRSGAAWRNLINCDQSEPSLSADNGRPAALGLSTWYICSSDIIERALRRGSIEVCVWSTQRHQGRVQLLPDHIVYYLSVLRATTVLLNRLTLVCSVLPPACVHYHENSSAED
jgi:hypothetical protein